MGKRGPKPKPTLTRLLEGNAGKLPLNPDEPKCELGPEKPHTVSADAFASAEWDRLRRVCPPLLYTAMDEGVLTQYCLAWSMLLNAQRDISENGNILITPIVNRDGDIVGEDRKLNPAVNAWAKANESLFKTGDRLGLSPSTRARINMPSQEEIKSKFAGLLGKK